MRDRGLNRIGKSGITVASAAEKQLVAAAKRGDELAFESLFKRHQRRIFVLVLRYTQIREDAEDVVQETFPESICAFSQIRGEILILHMGNAYRHQPSLDVATETSRVERGADRSSEQRRRSDTCHGGAGRRCRS